MWWKKNQWKGIILSVLCVAVLAAAFCFGGNAPASPARPVSGSGTPEAAPGAAVAAVTDEPAAKTPDAPEQVSKPAGGAKAGPEQTEKPGPSAGLPNRPDKTAEPASKPTVKPTPTPAGKAPEGYKWQNGMLINGETGQDAYRTDPVPAGRPLPVEPQGVAPGAAAHTCTLSISCGTILGNMDHLDSEKTELVPEDGWLLKAETVAFYEGESVFNVLQRTCKQRGIHMEFENTPLYNSAYIEGIGNLYEFDAGDLSGWMYKVNGWFPNYGCSRYQLKDGDRIEWVYTCDLGNDVGGYDAAGGS